MTTVYFIRHAQSDSSVREDPIRPLTEKGLNDCALVTEFLRDKKIDAVLSSPYKRAVDTVSGFAEATGLKVETVEDFRECRFGSIWVDDFKTFSKKQWVDFSYKQSDGESLYELQTRNIVALNKVLVQHKDKSIVIGTHGTALSTVINYYDNTYGYEDFIAMANIMPWVVKMYFVENNCAGIEKIDLFQSVQKPNHEKCKIRTADFGSLKAYRFVVIFSKYKNKWLYCRAKTRDAYETAGGSVEQGETPLEAARRELYEETGVTKFDIIPAFDYSVHMPNECANGQVFFANIYELGNIPNYEMAEVKLFDTMPEKMRFPTILPALYDKMQTWKARWKS